MRRFASLAVAIVTLQLSAHAFHLTNLWGHRQTGSSLSKCQEPQADGNQLRFCPPGTVYVSQKDGAAHFNTIQSAVQSLPLDSTPQTILIGPGTYQEVVEIFRSGPTTLLGVTPSPHDASANQVRLTYSSSVNTDAGGDLNDAVVLTVSPLQQPGLIGRKQAGALHSGNLGSVDFKAYNIDVINTAGPQNKAGALLVWRSNASFYASRFWSYQDTIYIADGAATFFYGCEVRGSVDYVYGEGTAVFVDSCFLTRALGALVFAWRDSGGAGAGKARPGVYVKGGRIDYSPDAVDPASMKGQGAIARPWASDRSTVILKQVFMSDLIKPEGFSPYTPQTPFISSSTNFAEYASLGPGGTNRTPKISKLLDEQQASDYTMESVFGGMPDWIDAEVANANLL